MPFADFFLFIYILGDIAKDGEADIQCYHRKDDCDDQLDNSNHLHLQESLSYLFFSILWEDVEHKYIPGIWLKSQKFATKRFFRVNRLI